MVGGRATEERRIDSWAQRMVHQGRGAIVAPLGDHDPYIAEALTRAHEARARQWEALPTEQRRRVEEELRSRGLQNARATSDDEDA